MTLAQLMALVKAASPPADANGHGGQLGTLDDLFQLHAMGRRG